MTLTVDVVAPPRDPDELVLAVAGRRLAGWTDIAVTLRCEGFPNAFSVGLSSRGPGGITATVAREGEECAVYLGGDLVLSGYVDRAREGGSGDGHALQIVGRGRTQDLVDCAAEWPTDQLVQGTALDIATRLAQPYGIAVVLGEGASAGDPVPAPWCLNYTETAAAIVQRVAQAAALLAYEDAGGRLLLANVGTATAASGIAYGENVESWSVERSMDHRYSEVVCCAMAMNAWGDLAGSDFFDTEIDPNVPRHRRLAIVMADVADDPQGFTIRKAKWEIARRAGRGLVVRATIDAWRDRAGALWRPNTLVPVRLPGVEATLAVSEVTFRRGEHGTHADLVLLPKEAFSPEPISLLPLAAADVTGVGG